MHMGFAINNYNNLYIFNNKYAWIKCSLKVIKSQTGKLKYCIYISVLKPDSELASLNTHAVNAFYIELRVAQLVFGSELSSYS